MRKRNLEMEYLRSQSQFNHFHSQRSALTDLLAICEKRYLETMGSAASQLNFERPLDLCYFMVFKLQNLWERNLEMEALWSHMEPQCNYLNSQIVALTDLIATCKKLYRYVLHSKIEEADSAPSQLNFECPLELCDSMFWELKNLIGRTLEIDDLPLQSQFNPIHSERLTDLFAICKKRYLKTMDSEIEEAELMFLKRNLEMGDLRSQSQFNHFHSQRSALTDLFARRKKTESEIEEADSVPSQLNFELPLELCDFMYCALQKLRKRNCELQELRKQNSEMEYLWSQLKFNHFHSQRLALTDLFARRTKMELEIDEADSAPSQLNFERPRELCDFIYCELQKLRKRNCELQKLRKRNSEMEYLWSQFNFDYFHSQFNHIHSQIVALTDILATFKMLYWLDLEIEEALELCDFMYCELQKLRKRNLKMVDLWSQSQFIYFHCPRSATPDLMLCWYMSDSKIEEADWAPSRFKLEPLPQLGNFLCLDRLTIRERILEYRDLRLLSQLARRQPWPSEENNLYLFFYLEDSPVMYTLYEIKVTKPFPLPPTEAAQDANKWDLSGLNLILQFETGMYPEEMCCVQLGSELYFFGGEFNLNKPNICIYKYLKKFKKDGRDVLPRDVYIFYSTLYREYPLLLCRLNENMLLQGRPMNSGKASPQAFVADGMIYVIGSTFTNLDNESFAYFEVYDPVEGMWTILPNPPIRNVNTRWVGNAVVGRKAVLVALQQGQNRLYCFDLDTHQWTNRVSIPDFLSGNFFSRKSEFIEDTLYGCYDNTVGAIAPLANNEDEDEDEEANNEDEDEEEEEEEDEEEEEEVQRVERLLEDHCLHLLSADMGMGAFLNIPGLLQSSSSLLHLENRYFCHVRVGTRPTFRHRQECREHALIIVIFQAIDGETYTEKAIATRFFRAKFVYSKHYKSFLPDSMGLFIKGCYAFG